MVMSDWKTEFGFHVARGWCAKNKLQPLDGSEANRQWESVTFSSAAFKCLVSFFKIQSNEPELYSYLFAVYIWPNTTALLLSSL